MIKAVIFDIDNTLTDFRTVKFSAIDAGIEAMIDAGIEMDFETVRNKIMKIYDKEGIEYQKVFDRFLLNEFGEIDYKILASGIVGYRRAREGQLVLYPHTKETLIKLIKKGILVAVVSDAPKLQAWLRLCYLQLHHIFDVVVAFEDTKKHKPHPAPFELALELLNIKPDEAIMVGDWLERDIIGAKKVGLLTAYAKYGEAFSKKAVDADYILRDVSQILDIVDKLNEE
jgi:putative hydrolase of the HAD superfamily